MVKLRAATIAFVFTMLLGAVLNQGTSEATNAKTKPQNARSEAKNKFLGHWSSHLTRASGERVNDGAFDISDVSPASADEVSILHSFRGGLFTGYIMPDPDRIEIRMPLGEDRFIQYDGVWVAADRIEGRYFVTEEKQRHHSRKRSASNRVSGSFAEEEGTWVATKP